MALMADRRINAASQGEFGGSEQQSYTIQLGNAAILSIRQIMPSLRDPILGNDHEYEEVSLIDRSISWIIEAERISHGEMLSA